jgi:hypothetical protein
VTTTHGPPVPAGTSSGRRTCRFCGIALGEVMVDRNRYKQGRYLPGSHIPIHHPDPLDQTRPDHILILPWNLRAEITAQARPHPRVGRRFVLPIPRLEVF